MILIDNIGHLVSTVDEDELHKFALTLRLKKKWFQNHPKHPHYDVTTAKKRNEAITLGAEFVTSKEIVERAYWYNN